MGLTIITLIVDRYNSLFFYTTTKKSYLQYELQIKDMQLKNLLHYFGNKFYRHQQVVHFINTFSEFKIINHTTAQREAQNRC